MEDQKNWFQISNLNELDTPALVVFPGRIKRNILTAIDMLGDVKRLRPHVKTHKSASVVEMMMTMGIQKFKCATIAEAEMLGICKAADVLLAYQPTGPKLKRFVELILRYPGTLFSCLVDNKDSALELSSAFATIGLQIPVYIDLNVGMNRTGIAPGNTAIELYEYCSAIDGIVITGLHAYDGHIRNADINARVRECDDAYAAVLKMIGQLIEKGFDVPVIIAGGSHTFPVHCKRNNIECSPGTFIYWDKGNKDYCPEQDFDIAALLVTRVVSKPGINKICTDLGHKSVAAENPLTNRVYFLNVPELVAIGQSEEHLVLETTNPSIYQVGDVLYGVPIHICPTVALYECVHTIENGIVYGQWETTARARKINV